MYWISRLMLRLAVAACAHSVLMLAVLYSPWSWVVLALLVVIALRQWRKRRTLTAHGTASFATEDQLRQAGMIDATRGLFLGRLCGPAQVGLKAAYRALLDRKLGARDACRRFFAALRRRREGPLVRLPQAINTAVFAPVGAGKSTGLVIPFLLSCEESCVVIDFKGELALATAEARRRMGHEIVILDPYGVVTQ
jgi:type IV secretion system protein VirD4